MIGREQDGEIVQLGTDADGQLARWRFTAITPNSFRWLAEVSADQGANWRMVTDFTAVRMAS